MCSLEYQLYAEKTDISAFQGTKTKENTEPRYIYFFLFAGNRIQLINFLT